MDILGLSPLWIGIGIGFGIGVAAMALARRISEH
jgi:hypothetical protein